MSDTQAKKRARNNAPDKVDEKLQEYVEAKKEAKAITVNEAEKKRKKLYKHYQDEEKYPVQISPLYKPTFGEVMSIHINGFSIYVPCDGKIYNVPKTFAAEVASRIGKADQYSENTERMSDIQNNIDPLEAPGELKLI